MSCAEYKYAGKGRTNSLFLLLDNAHATQDQQNVILRLILTLDIDAGPDETNLGLVNGLLPVQLALAHQI